MSAIRILLGIFCLVAFGFSSEPSSGILIPKFGSRIESVDRLGNQLLAVATTQLGVREATGNNDGKQVESYLRYTGNHKGEPWCASFVSWVFGQVGLASPRTAWSPDLFPRSKTTTLPKPADVLGIYSPNLARIAHCGLVERLQHHWIVSIEGNTNADGGREGDGVYRKWRHQRTIKVYARWHAVQEEGGLK